VLEQDHVWLREPFAATDAERLKIWEELRDAKLAKHVRDAYRHALNLAVSGASSPTVSSRRRAGVGSLGRPRIVALTGDAGGPIAREAKALLPSCWDRESAVGEQFGLSTSRYRSPDPFLLLDEGVTVRRLAPNSRKIDLNSHRRRVRRRLVGAMARDIGAIHAADECAPMVLEHLRAEGLGG